MSLLEVVGCVFVGLLIWCGLAALVALVWGPVAADRYDDTPGDVVLTDDERKKFAEIAAHY